MKRLDPILAHQRVANGFFYLLAKDLDVEESLHVLGDEIPRIEFFRSHWPDLYSWLLLNSNQHNWSLYYRGNYPDVGFILALFFDNAICFNKAFADEIEFVERL